MVAAASSDLSSLVASLHYAKTHIKDEAQKILEHTGEEILEKMRQKVPVDTGRLRDSLRMITEPGRVTIGPVGVEYAYYVEYGTGSRGELAKTKTKTNGVRMIQANGQWIPLLKDYGQKAQPYMRPAAAEVLLPLGVPYAEAGARLIKGQSNAAAA